MIVSISQLNFNNTPIGYGRFGQAEAEKYDDLCGIKRKYISTRKMAHIRQRVKDRQRVKIATSHQEIN